MWVMIILSPNLGRWIHHHLSGISYREISWQPTQGKRWRRGGWYFDDNVFFTGWPNSRLIGTAHQKILRMSLQRLTRIKWTQKTLNLWMNLLSLGMVWPNKQVPWGWKQTRLHSKGFLLLYNIFSLFSFLFIHTVGDRLSSDNIGQMVVFRLVTVAWCSNREGFKKNMSEIWVFGWTSVDPSPTPQLGPCYQGDFFLSFYSNPYPSKHESALWSTFSPSDILGKLWTK